MANPQVEQGGLYSALGFDSGGNAQVEQGGLYAAVSFVPPETNSQVEQGALYVAARRYRIIGFASLGPMIDLPSIGPYNEINYVWRA